MLTRLGASSALAVSLVDLKQRIRVDTNDDDATLEALIRSETDRYEDYTGRFMTPGQFEWRATGWVGTICIPVAPCRHVTEVAYLDVARQEHVLASTDWSYEIAAEHVAVRFAASFARPALAALSYPVIVRFTAGYEDPSASGSGDDPALHPNENDRRNIMLMVQRIYDQDEALPDADFRKYFGNRRIFR